ncbi:MAG: short-chain dehydrogenase/reductase SDR [uncultured bacterium]|nr:MAG: short-chain dehydrogenase/reductase SDR [uncultured bacterium]
MKESIITLRNKVICLIGYSGLIGQAILQGLIDSGAVVICGSRNHPKINIKKSKRIYFYEIDISNEKSIESFIDKACVIHKKIDVWINCSLPKIKYSNYNWEYIKISEMLEDINGHLLGYFNSCRYVLKQMKKQKSGSIINFGSIHGEVIPDMSIYNNTEIQKPPTYFMNKAGIHILSKYFAEIGSEYNIRVNTISPGGIFDNHSKVFVDKYTSKVPLKRMGMPDDVVGCTLLLASDSSSYITGQTFFIDGGLTLR